VPLAIELIKKGSKHGYSRGRCSQQVGGLKSDTLTLIVYQRAKELATVAYPDESDPKHKEVIRECLYGHSIDLLPGTVLIEMLQANIITQD